MNLGWLDAGFADATTKERGTILHEFGHALGLLHEHQSPARGNSLHLDEASSFSSFMFRVLAQTAQSCHRLLHRRPRLD
jgi:hypothetical protein